jgi:uncharacterized protein YbjT (DUF2867 family)
MKAIIVGASGLIGNHLLNLLIANQSYTNITVLVRKKLTIEHPKLIQKIVDFDKLYDYKELFIADVLFCTLGTTINKAGSKEAFMKVDYEYPFELAKICKETNIKQFHIVTALGANSTSSVFYNQVKGRVEEAIKQLSLNNFSIYRPSMLLGNRDELRIGEKIGQVIMSVCSFLFIGPLKKYKAIKGSTVAHAMMHQALLNKSGLYIFESDEISEL